MTDSLQERLRKLADSLETGFGWHGVANLMHKAIMHQAADELDKLSRPTSVSEEQVEDLWNRFMRAEIVTIRDLIRAALQAASVAGGDVEREAYLEGRCKSAEDAMQFLAESFPEGDIGMMFAVMQARAHWERYAPESPSVDAGGYVAVQIENSLPQKRLPDDGCGDEDAFNSGWNACIAALRAKKEGA